MTARSPDMEPVRRLSYGPAAFEKPHKRPDRCQHPTTRQPTKNPLASPGTSTNEPNPFYGFTSKPIKAFHGFTRGTLVVYHVGCLQNGRHGPGTALPDATIVASAIGHRGEGKTPAISSQGSAWGLTSDKRLENLLIMENCGQQAAPYGRTGQPYSSSLSLAW